MNKMLTHLNGYKREAVLAPLFKMLEATFDLFVPLVMADIVNVGIAAHDLHYILVRCGVLLLLAVIGLTCSLTAQYFSAKAAVGYSTSLRHALFEHQLETVKAEMDRLEKTLDMLRFKCWYYERAMADGSEDALHEMIPDKLPPEIKAIYDNAHSD